jgi:hypothetical protein
MSAPIPHDELVETLMKMKYYIGVLDEASEPSEEELRALPYTELLSRVIWHSNTATDKMRMQPSRAPVTAAFMWRVHDAGLSCGAIYRDVQCARRVAVALGGPRPSS